MTIDQFWKIVDEVHLASGGDMRAKRKLLEERLGELATEEIGSFAGHFNECMDQAYTWELWAAAFIINGGCSDDAFSDFRATLVSTGRRRFEAVVASPDSLAEEDAGEGDDFFEGYQYVAFSIYKKRTGKMPTRPRPHPKMPSGREWEEKKVAAVCPKLARKHGMGG